MTHSTAILTSEGCPDQNSHSKPNYINKLERSSNTCEQDFGNASHTKHVSLVV
jgi:hypothetical protein